jgi:DNA-binding response OmpR family regulator
MNHKKILVVEEDLKFRKIIISCVEDFQLISVSDIPKAFALISNVSFDLAILNTKNTQGNSIELCRRIKLETNSKVLFLSKSNNIELKESCFESGADDFLTIPFYPKELTIRTKKMLDELSYRKEILNFNKGISLNIKNRSINVNECTIPLSPTEFLICEYMFNHNGYQKPEYLQTYISNRKNKELSLNSLIVLIKRLRDKIEKSTGREIIKTRYGVGYYISI